EGVPRSTQEALALGRPVITTNVPGCRETVIDGINGFLIPHKNVEKLVEAMEKFILNPELIEKMGKESRKIAESKFDVNVINERFLNELL
ncbi:MAG: glycosyltransferase, partial [Fervidobacterium sp.]